MRSLLDDIARARRSSPRPPVMRQRVIGILSAIGEDQSTAEVSLYGDQPVTVPIMPGQYSIGGKVYVQMDITSGRPDIILGPAGSIYDTPERDDGLLEAPPFSPDPQYEGDPPAGGIVVVDPKITTKPLPRPMAPEAMGGLGSLTVRATGIFAEDLLTQASVTGYNAYYFGEDDPYLPAFDRLGGRIPDPLGGSVTFSAPPGAYLVGITSVDAQGLESEISELVTAVSEATGDNRKPLAPTGLEVTSETDIRTDRYPIARVLLTWTPVTFADDNSMIDVDRYEVWAKEGVGPLSLIGASIAPEFSFESEQGVNWSFQVRALAAGSTKASELSDPVAHTAAIDSTPVALPTGYSATGTLGGIQVNWDGTFNGEMPESFDLLEVYVSTTNSFDSARIRTTIALGGGSQLIPGPYVPHYVWFIARLLDLRASDPAGPVTATPGKATQDDIGEGAIASWNISDFAITAKKLNTATHFIY
jgi:hypothetical protein